MPKATNIAAIARRGREPTATELLDLLKNKDRAEELSALYSERAKEVRDAVKALSAETRQAKEELTGRENALATEQAEHEAALADAAKTAADNAQRQDQPQGAAAAAGSIDRLEPAGGQRQRGKQNGTAVKQRHSRSVRAQR